MWGHVRRTTHPGASTPQPSHLDALAARVGVHKGHLSRIERGQKAPSLATLEAIAMGLGASMSELFGEKAAADDVIVARAGPGSRPVTPVMRFTLCCRPRRDGPPLCTWSNRARRSSPRIVLPMAARRSLMSWQGGRTCRGGPQRRPRYRRLRHLRWRPAAPPPPPRQRTGIGAGDHHRLRRRSGIVPLNPAPSAQRCPAERPDSAGPSPPGCWRWCGRRGGCGTICGWPAPRARARAGWSNGSGHP